MIGQADVKVYNNTRPINWDGNVALMYPSDMYMTYANGVNEKCYNSPESCKNGIPTMSWIYNSNILEGKGKEAISFISPYDGTSYFILYSRLDGYLFYGSDYSGNSTNGVRPVVYLSADVSIAEGDGSSENPYKLSGN